MSEREERVVWGMGTEISRSWHERFTHSLTPVALHGNSGTGDEIRFKQRVLVPTPGREAIRRTVERDTL